ncbi:hypothetical protein [Hahella ganghwensis]|uniref:hypothetical protein n=1 Tax=Hahella ganghwensis TaxID=286420 RepID=UPI0004755BC7|nr:hypothetical protein [Hahella ganghwensis]
MTPTNFVAALHDYLELQQEPKDILDLHDSEIRATALRDFVDFALETRFFSTAPDKDRTAASRNAETLVYNHRCRLIMSLREILLRTFMHTIEGNTAAASELLESVLSRS